MGVMASGPEGERACYSNRGWIAAPGGNPGDGMGGCDPQAVNLCDGPDCGAGLIGAAQHLGYYAYYYWMGTSFAAPLVSGVCALTLEQGSDVCRPGTSIQALACPSPEGLMVVNVPVALGGASCPMP